MQAQSSRYFTVKPALTKSTGIQRCTTRRQISLPVCMTLKVERWNDEKHGKLSKKAMLKRLKDEGYSGSIYQFPPGTEFPYHSHSCDKKDSIITGRFKFVSRDKGEVTLEPGDVLHVPKGLEHKAETIGTETVTFVDASKY